MTDDKDELAKLLGEMAEGEHAEEDHAHKDHDDHIGHLTEPPPPPPAQPAAKQPQPPTPIAKSPPTLPPTPPRPAVKPAPKPPAPIAKPIVPPTATPARTPVKAALPPRPAPAPKPIAPAPTPKPLFTPPAQAPLPTPMPTPPPASTPIIADEEEPQRYSGTDDDAVIVPAMAPTELAKPHALLPRRQHLSQKLYFKQTIIPILLTLGLICVMIPILGLLSSTYSPFKVLAEIYFIATFWPLGLAFVVFGLLTMFSVKKQLEPPAPLES